MLYQKRVNGIVQNWVNNFTANTQKAHGKTGKILSTNAHIVGVTSLPKTFITQKQIIFAVINAKLHTEESRELMILKCNVRNAGIPSKQINMQSPNTVKTVGIESIRMIDKQDVYNMEVEDNHNFAVNGGYIVHNCMDDIRYFAFSILKPRLDNKSTRGFGRYG